MSRDLTAGMQAAIVEAVVNTVILYKGEFDTGTVRLWTGVGPLQWGGETYVGGGQMLQISAIEETVESRAAGIELSLSGLPAELVSLALGECRMGKRGWFWLGLLDGAGQLIADPYQIFAGLLDVPSMEESGDGASITISYENRLVGLTVPNARRYTAEDQKAIYPDDSGFNAVAGLQDASIVW